MFLPPRTSLSFCFARQTPFSRSRRMRMLRQARLGLAVFAAVILLVWLRVSPMLSESAPLESDTAPEIQSRSGDTLAQLTIPPHVEDGEQEVRRECMLCCIYPKYMLAHRWRSPKRPFLCAQTAGICF